MNNYNDNFKPRGNYSEYYITIDIVFGIGSFPVVMYFVIFVRICELIQYTICGVNEYY